MSRLSFKKRLSYLKNAKKIGWKEQWKEDKENMVDQMPLIVSIHEKIKKQLKVLQNEWIVS